MFKVFKMFKMFNCFEYFKLFKWRALTVLQQDEGRVEWENLLGKFHLRNLPSKLKDLVHQGHLLRDVGGEEGADGKHDVVEEDGVVGQVEVAAHPDDRQLETPWCETGVRKLSDISIVQHKASRQKNSRWWK